MQESLKLGVDLKLGSADIPLNPDWFINRDPCFLAYEIIPIQLITLPETNNIAPENR